ncbi:endonuclease/exonuclease/phosphatase family protein [Micromonospora sp. WMMD961]|uniref:endonuclease/exonuclease/phosphatase family protein n=1 Tax=Micromonospora sp. WMMD961 TaxID=3016100 RepID=UPI00241643D8|nr:endonuclease/exonuclease/phosphatase family protein [Micromonospora sp. WMMD961]MDG4781351.1 endonuclease/exonuclease/phosphatase family protein [Micromonospora sp. WMMD961]
MAARSYRFLRRTLAVCCLLAAAALPATPTAAVHTDDADPTILRMLQMNLCNSGRAGCYTGRAMGKAIEVIRAEAPDLVTLNEICADDLPVLHGVFEAVHPERTVVAVFQAAGDRPSGDDTRCRNGQRFGIGLLTHVRTTDTPHTVYRGIHPTQDLADPEERAWLCVDVDGALLACTTHLSATGDRVALTQCDHLLDTILPTISRAAADQPVVLGGDLNLLAGHDPDVRSCTPPGHQRIGDGRLQHIMATGDINLCCRRLVPMHGVTDHAALLTTLVIERRSPGRPAERLTAPS